MASYNKVILAGNLTKDPELRYTQSGKAVCNFDIAVNDGFGEKKTTLFIRILTFNKQAENSNQYLKKGSPVLVDGKLQISSWEKEDGTKSYRTEVLAFVVQFLKGNGNSSSASNQTESKAPVDKEDDDYGEIPF